MKNPTTPAEADAIVGIDAIRMSADYLCRLICHCCQSRAERDLAIGYISQACQVAVVSIEKSVTTQELASTYLCPVCKSEMDNLGEDPRGFENHQCVSCRTLIHKINPRHPSSGFSNSFPSDRPETWRDIAIRDPML